LDQQSLQRHFENCKLKLNGLQTLESNLKIAKYSLQITDQWSPKRVVAISVVARLFGDIANRPLLLLHVFRSAPRLDMLRCNTSGAAK